MSDADEVKAARDLLAAEGYAVVKAKSYHQVARDRDVALAQRDFAVREADSVKSWAHDAFEQERHLRDRLTFVYGVAMQHGATHEDLRGGPEQASTRANIGETQGGAASS